MNRLLAVAVLVLAATAARAAVPTGVRISTALPSGCLTFDATRPTVLSDGSTVYPQMSPQAVPLAVCSDEAAKAQPVGGTVYMIVISAACHPRSPAFSRRHPMMSGPLAYDPKIKRCGPLKQVPARGEWSAY